MTRPTPPTTELRGERSRHRAQLVPPEGPAPLALVDPSRLAPRDRAPLDGETLAALAALVARCTPRSVASASGLAHTTVRRALRGERVSSAVRRSLAELVRVAPSAPASERAA